MTTRIPPSTVFVQALPALRRSAIIGKNSREMFLVLLSFWLTPMESRNTRVSESAIRQFVVEALRCAENDEERLSLDAILDYGVRAFDPAEIARICSTSSSLG